MIRNLKNNSTFSNERQPRGLGDSIARFAKTTGIHNLAQMGAKAMVKKDCGCKKRQQALNKAFPYKK